MIVGTPPKTASLAIICQDPDAGGFVQWLSWNLPGQTSTLPENFLPSGALQGVNDFGNTGYGGPCPPPASVAQANGMPVQHHYIFTVYALEVALGAAGGASLNQLRSAMTGHIIASASRTSLYQKAGQ